MTDTPAEVIARPAFLDAPAVAAVLAALPGARAVGGCVRDALARRANADVDIAAPLPPDDIAARLRAAGLKVFETGMSHGTVTAVLDRAPVEVTALRRDMLTDGRHAVVEWTTDWREDACRRDFTINAMSLAPDGALFDYFTGRADVAAGRVRFVGDPDTRLAEDYLRALRFFRFQARYGVGQPDAAAVAAIRRAVPGLGRLSAERVWLELKRIMSVPDPVAAVGLMAQTGVLGAVLPEAASLDLFQAVVAAGAPADPVLRFTALLDRDDQGQMMRASGHAAARLKMSGDEQGMMAALLGDVATSGPPNAFAVAPSLTGAHLRRLLARLETSWRAQDPHAILLGRSWLAQALPPARWFQSNLWSGSAAAWEALRDRIRAEPIPVFPLAGRDVLAQGIEPGRIVGSLIDAIRDWWTEGGCTANRDACLAELARRIAADAAGPANRTVAPTGTGGGDGTALGG
ncbi:CCA tRNA nucleotidyltransferase [Roseomonas sp. CECT 9278]|uniref:CCA tRNA nucleotidyltransferase n=1 Tax=Roseomonas sp. CECT 9278 TaxID=2845823 RepID=UPI001E4C35DE|nr:CCA tRNA nucleotidyltransferase [Roseomonas sp. CECT 9278]CAH0285332.1 CCA-adding enzyme [Roseomonas sp. CECT 9278]